MVKRIPDTFISLSKILVVVVDASKHVKKKHCKNKQKLD